MKFPIKLKVDPKLNVEQYHKGEFIGMRSCPRISDVERFLAEGNEDLNLYEGMRQVGDPVILLQGLEQMGFASFPELAGVFKKVDEELWGEITEEEDAKVGKAWEDAKGKEWIMTWTPADVEWSPEAASARDIFHRKYRYDDLMAMKADEVRNIARIKGVKAGTKEDMARRIHHHDFGEEEVGKTIESIEKLMATIGDHRRIP